MLGKDYLLKGVDRDLQKEFKAACAYLEMSMKSVLVKHMESIVAGYRKERAMFDKPKIYKLRKGNK
ncbi:unnamed protein product [marine sediment metagenome]|uniref:Uncharacterized protein n=1 Tax=marine sediment metagenome TaxID=412755 RepID=X1H4H8_9ZZZZ